MNNEQLMNNRGTEKVIKSQLTKFGNEKVFASTDEGMYAISKEAVRLNELMLNNTAKRKPGWYNVVDIDIIASAIYYMAFKCSITNTKIKWARQPIIEGLAKELLDGDVKYALSFVEWLVANSDMFSKNTTYIKNKTVSTYSFCEEYSEEMMAAINLKAVNSFYPLPMTTKPLDWVIEEGKLIQGGYETKQYPIIKNSKSNNVPDWILNTINVMQSTSYKINKIALTAVERDLVQPSRDAYITIKFEENKAEYYYQKKMYESALGKYRATKLMITIAKQYQDEANIYFPMNMDYRGRMYSIPVFLQPQGDEKTKAVLEFSEGITLTGEGEDNVYFTLAGLWGEDKKTRLERIEIGKTVIYNDWAEADEPYQFLTLQNQMLRWKDDNTTQIYTPCHLDGCTNGSQHTAALTGCIKTALATNVIPSIERRDMYVEVAELTSKKASESTSVYAPYINECLLSAGRTYAKRPTMIAQYGGKLKSFAGYTYDTMKELNPDTTFCTNSCSFAFASMIQSSLNGVLVGGTLFEKWIKNAAKAINGELTWTTPDGFKVIMNNKKYDVVKLDVRLDKHKVKLNLNVPTNEIDVTKIKSAISPNFVHSMDATHLRMTIGDCIYKGMTQFNCIHDSFGCNMNEMSTLLQATKDSWCNIYEDFTIGEDLKDELQEQTDIILDKFPLIEKFDMSQVQKSEHFFA